MAMLPTFEEYLGEMATVDGNQERGICQICGREQAVRDKGNITHHGYTIEYGWFSGTCPGQKHKPLQFDKSETLRQIKAIEEEIPEITKRIAKLKSGKIHPLKIDNGSRGYGRNKETMWINWEDAPPGMRLRAVESAIYAEERRIRAGKDTITFLKNLIVNFFGKELKVVERQAPKEKIGVGSVVNIAGYKNVTITKIEARTVHGVSHTINGQYLDHAFWNDPDTGKERSWPLKLARRPK